MSRQCRKRTEVTENPGNRIRSLAIIATILGACCLGITFVTRGSRSAAFDGLTDNAQLRCLNDIQEHGGVNLYVFVVNSPVSTLDGWGHDFVPFPVIVSKVVVTGATIGEGTVLAGGLGGLAGPMSVWVLMQSVQAPTVYPDPQYTGIHNPVPSFCSSRKRPRPDPSECQQYANACVGSGQDCVSCLLECKRNGSWPDYKCD